MESWLVIENVYNDFQTAYNTNISIKEYAIFLKIVKTIIDTDNIISVKHEILNILIESNIQYSINNMADVTSFINKTKQNGIYIPYHILSK